METELDTKQEVKTQKELSEPMKNVVEKDHVKQKKTSIPIPGLHTLYRQDSKSRSLAAVVPKGKLYQLQPRVIHRPQTPEHKKVRPPRFIPFEPYTAAINPIIPKPNQNIHLKKVDKNNLDINVLITQMSNMKSAELSSSSPVKTVAPVPVSSQSEEMAKELAKLKEERDYFQNQLKFQVKVNSELKNLLVASVGEDLQTRVNLLTEDKLQLAKALLDTAKNLTTHTEQIEFLAGQCEVWRSKFLASSVMIEELARWKADLTNKTTLLTEGNKKMLQLTAQVREMELHMLKNLKFLAKLKNLNLPSTDCLTLASECLNITDQMVLHTGGVGMPGSLNLKCGLGSMTEQEKYAKQALATTNNQLMSTEEASIAIVDQAHRKLSLSAEEKPECIDRT